ncbi:MAG: ankyrin repeat domain-containing protein [Bryobacterales bacterium]|nr:ankyrin repeat domain-containing protein [Bryobacterales bacterium]
MNADQAAVLSLLQQKVDVNAPQADGATALQWAVYRDDLQMADVLIAAGANVALPNREGATPLYLASEHGSAAMIEKLLKAGANPNELGPQGATPLMLAARSGNLDAIGVLLNHHADVNAKEALRGTTALMWAAEQGHSEAMKLLIEHGANVSAATNVDTRNARNNLANTVKQRLHSSFGVLGQRGRGPNSPLTETAPPPKNTAPTVERDVTAKTAGPIELQSAGRAASQPKGPTATQPNGEAATQPQGPAATRPKGPAATQPNGEAATQPNGPAATQPNGEAATQPNGEDQVFSFFRAPAKKDGGGLTPLVYAARQNCMECAEALIKAGADVNQRTHYGWTPLLVATQNRHYKLAAYLLDHGANPNIPNNGGWTPLYLATDNRNIEGGDYPVRTPDMDHLDFIKLLIAKGANVNARICGVESTQEECTGDSTETRTNFTMQWLFEDGATPFLRAAQSGDVELMKLLLAHGANPKIFTAHNVTPLAVASGIGWVEGVTYEWSPQENLEAVKMCLDLGIDPNVADDEGRTALHGAAHKGRLEVIQMLVDHGAKLDAHDGGSRDSVNGALLGKTWIPLDWARGLVRVGVQSAIAHPEAAALLSKLMTERNIPIPPPPTSSICLTKGLNGCQ